MIKNNDWQIINEPSQLVTPKNFEKLYKKNNYMTNLRKKLVEEYSLKYPQMRSGDINDRIFNKLRAEYMGKVIK